MDSPRSPVDETVSFASVLNGYSSQRKNWMEYPKQGADEAFTAIASSESINDANQTGTTEEHFTSIPKEDVTEQKPAKRNSCELDSCWSWLVCVVCAVCNIIICGSTYCYGILFPALLDAFQQGKANTALVGSLAMMGTGLYSIFVCKVYNRIGPIKTGTIGIIVCIGSLLITAQGTSIYFIMFSYGIVFGIASCFVFFPLYLTIPRYFDKRRSLALGLVAIGPGGGLFVMSPIAQGLLDALDWRGTFMAMAGIVALICPLLCVFQRMPDDQSQCNRLGNRETKLCDFSVFKNKRYVIYTLATCLMYAGHYIPSVHMVRYCENLGIPATQSSKFYLYSGVTSMLIRPLVGRLCDIKWIHACYLFQIAATIDGLAALLLPLARKNIHFVFYFIFYGSSDGAMGCALCIAVMFCFKGVKRVQGYGLYQSLTNVAAAFGPALGGFVADSFGSYPPAFYTAGGFVLLSASLILLIPFLKRDQVDNEEDTTVTELLMIVEKCTVV